MAPAPDLASNHPKAGHNDDEGSPKTNRPAGRPAFYARVRQDALIGPVFNGAIGDWPEHLDKLQAFWSSVMLTSGRYKGRPLPAHISHGATITPATFERWLELWRETTERGAARPGHRRGASRKKRSGSPRACSWGSALPARTGWASVRQWPREHDLPEPRDAPLRTAGRSGAGSFDARLHRRHRAGGIARRSLHEGRAAGAASTSCRASCATRCAIRVAPLRRRSSRRNQRRRLSNPPSSIGSSQLVRSNSRSNSGARRSAEIALCIDRNRPHERAHANDDLQPCSRACGMTAGQGLDPAAVRRDRRPGAAHAAAVALRPRCRRAAARRTCGSSAPRAASSTTSGFRAQRGRGARGACAGRASTSPRSPSASSRG